MKKLFLGAISIVLAGVMLIGTAGCFGGSPKTYTVQYTVEGNNYQLTVTEGEPYAIESVPQKTGYDFLGLFDAETGGTQYVSASGSSVSVYNNKSGVILYPQWKAKEYTLILDYQGAAVTGDRQLKVSYDESLPALPKNLELANYNFKGWYTAENCGGVQVADEYGLLPVVSVVNENNFDLRNGSITLFAGFELKKFTVTMHIGNTTEEMQIVYNTPIEKIVPETRYNGMAPLVWSESESGSKYTGKITGDITLYAIEFAPVIDFDTDGGLPVTPLVAISGATVTLPEAEKENYKFLYWEDSTGKATTIKTMPANGAQLKAVWQAKIVFDENGGEEVADISKPAGETVSLPVPVRDGYVFAGWYTADKEKYEATKMPATGIKLKAGWYKTKSAKKIFLEEGDESSLIYTKVPVFKAKYRIDFTEEISDMNWSKSVNVKLAFCADIKHAKTSDQFVSHPTYATKEHFYYYSQENVSDAYFMGVSIVDHGKGLVNESYTQTKFTTSLNVTSGKIFIALGADKDSYYNQYGSLRCGAGWKMTNFWVEIYYPDTTNLYL